MYGVYYYQRGSISSLRIIIIFLFIVFLINFPSFACFIIVLSLPLLVLILVLFTLRTFNNLQSSSPVSLRCSCLWSYDSSLDLRAYQQLASQLKFAIFNCYGNAISQRLSPTSPPHKKRCQQQHQHRLHLRLYGFRYEFHHSHLVCHHCQLAAKWHVRVFITPTTALSFSISLSLSRSRSPFASHFI